jgi:hypothetical protein
MEEVLSVAESTRSIRLAIVVARLAGQLKQEKVREDWLRRARHDLATSDDVIASMECVSEYCWDLRASAAAPESELEELLGQLDDYGRRTQTRWALAQASFQRLLAAPDGTNVDPVRISDAIGQLVRMDANDLWALFPIVARLLGPLMTVAPRICLTLLKMIGDSDGPFARAQFDNSLSASELLGFVRLANELEFGDSGVQTAKSDDSEAASSLAKSAAEPIAQAALSLASAWPYHILRVLPPLGTRSRSLRESTA